MRCIFALAVWLAASSALADFIDLYGGRNLSISEGASASIGLVAPADNSAWSAKLEQDGALAMQQSMRDSMMIAATGSVAAPLGVRAASYFQAVFHVSEPTRVLIEVNLDGGSCNVELVRSGGSVYLIPSSQSGIYEVQLDRGWTYMASASANLKNGAASYTLSMVIVPEPQSLVLACLAAIGLGLNTWRRRQGKTGGPL